MLELKFFNNDQTPNNLDRSYAAALSIRGGHTPGQNSDVYWVNEHVDPTSSEAQVLALIGDGMTGAHQTAPLVGELFTGYWAARNVIDGFPVAFTQQHAHLLLDSRIKAAISIITNQMRNQYKAFLEEQFRKIKKTTVIPDGYLPSATTLAGIIKDPLKTHFFAIGNSPAFAIAPGAIVQSQILIGHEKGWVWPCGVYAKDGKIETLDEWLKDPRALNILSVDNSLLQGGYGILCCDGLIKHVLQIAGGGEAVDPQSEVELVQCVDPSSITITMRNILDHALLHHMDPDWDDDKTFIIVKH